jgi:hypothetical protein
LGPPSTVQTDSDTGERYIWKKGPNNKYIKVYEESNEGFGIDTSNPRQSYLGRSKSGPLTASIDSRLELMEEEMLEAALGRSMQDVYAHQDSVTGERYMWKKGLHNRYIKVYESNEGFGIDTRNARQSCLGRSKSGPLTASRDSRVELMEEEMLEAALERSIQMTDPEREQLMIEEALERRMSNLSFGGLLERNSPFPSSSSSGSLPFQIFSR